MNHTLFPQLEVIDGRRYGEENRYLRHVLFRSFGINGVDRSFLVALNDVLQ